MSLVNFEDLIGQEIPIEGTMMIESYDPSTDEYDVSINGVVLGGLIEDEVENLLLSTSRDYYIQYLKNHSNSINCKIKELEDEKAER